MGEPEPAVGTYARTLFRLGEVLGDNYEVTRLLGEGGLGQVFAAHDRCLNREVAIKAYWPIQEPNHATVLRREAQAQAAIQHPSLPAVFTMGRHGALDFMVMERIRGVGLDETIAQRHRIGARLPLGETLRILLALAEVMAAVHTAGCTHRDIKPGNVMLAAQRVVLTDFGLSRAEGETIGGLEGSPNYMAPEAILDHVERGAGHRVDLYALGVIGFEMLAGRLPYPGRSLEDTFTQHVHAKVPELDALVPGIPLRLSALIRSLLAKEPYDRPESEEVVHRLGAIRDEHARQVKRSLTPPG